MTSTSTLTFLRAPRCHKAQTAIIEAAVHAADEIAGEMGLSEREREIVLRLAAGALLWLPKLWRGLRVQSSCLPCRSSHLSSPSSRLVPLVDKPV
jgi:hypothetical protein